jgi:transposase
LDLIKLTTAAQTIIALVQSHQAANCCPLCHHPSSRIHSRYIRHLLDLPWHGVAMRGELHVRRFFCDESSCRRRIFTERLPQVVAPYARRTARLDEWFRLVGLALGGEAGACLLRRRGVCTSPDALLSPIRSLRYAVPIAPRAVGIDEFAFRRGRVFATILVDRETRRVIDVVPDCDQATVQRWRENHPSIEVVSRDRATNFGEAIRQGAPQAIQVADRWHVLENLGNRLETFWRERKTLLQTPRQALLDAHSPLRCQRRCKKAHRRSRCAPPDFFIR